MRAPVRRLALPLILLLSATPILQGRATLDESQRLSALCKVWGLLKYYHPDVAGGTIDWDQALVDAIPGVKTAQTRDDLNRELMALAQTAGPSLPAGPAPGALFPHDVFGWLDDDTVMDPAVAAHLKLIVTGNQPAPANRYITHRVGYVDSRGSGTTDNPDFSVDTAGYDGPTYPGEAHRLLALFRYWNMIQYFSTNRGLLDRDWGEVLAEFVPRMEQAASATEYHQALAELIANITDTHGFTGSSVFWAWVGPYALPIQTRLIEGQTVIVKVFPRLLGGADLRVGDVISAIDGTPAATVRDRLKKYVNASNPDALARVLDRNFFIWSPTTAARTVTVVHDGGASATVPVVPVNGNEWVTDLNASFDPTAYKLLRDNIGYLGMGVLRISDVSAAMQLLKNTRAIIVDSRRYPNSTMSTLLEYLEPTAQPMARFTYPDFAHPGSLRWSSNAIYGPTGSNPNYYKGRVVVLVDENTQSQGEYTVMGLRSAPATTVIGSRTAGADGNVALIKLPGGFSTYISGITVFYPDGRPTQRVGIVPDIEVRPTIAGTRQGRDELMEAALAFIYAQDARRRPPPAGSEIRGRAVPRVPGRH